MEIIKLDVSKSIVDKIKSLHEDLQKKKQLKNEYKISVNEYMNHKQIFKEKCRSMISELYRVKMFHYGRTTANIQEI